MISHEITTITTSSSASYLGQNTKNTNHLRILTFSTAVLSDFLKDNVEANNSRRSSRTTNKFENTAVIDNSLFILRVVRALPICPSMFAPTSVL